MINLLLELLDLMEKLDSLDLKNDLLTILRVLLDCFKKIRTTSLSKNLILLDLGTNFQQMMEKLIKFQSLPTNPITFHCFFTIFTIPRKQKKNFEICHEKCCNQKVGSWCSKHYLVRRNWILQKSRRWLQKKSLLSCKRMWQRCEKNEKDSQSVVQWLQRFFFLSFWLLRSILRVFKDADVEIAKNRLKNSKNVLQSLAKTIGTSEEEFNSEFEGWNNSLIDRIIQKRAAVTEWNFILPIKHTFSSFPANSHFWREILCHHQSNTKKKNKAQQW